MIRSPKPCGQELKKVGSSSPRSHVPDRSASLTIADRRTSDGANTLRIWKQITTRIMRASTFCQERASSYFEMRRAGIGRHDRVCLKTSRRDRSKRGWTPTEQHWRCTKPHSAKAEDDSVPVAIARSLYRQPMSAGDDTSNKGLSTNPNHTPLRPELLPTTSVDIQIRNSRNRKVRVEESLRP